MSASSRRPLRTRIVEWFVMTDPDPQPSRLDLDDHPISRMNTAISTDATLGGELRALGSPSPADRSGATGPAFPAGERRTSGPTGPRRRERA